MTIRRVTIIALLSAILAGCSWMPFFGRDDDEPEATSEQVLYQAAQRSLRSGNHNQAIELLQRLESQFPFGRYAEQAQLELIYAYYKAFRPESARSAADRFIRLHPQHPNVDYAYYLKGLAAYEQDQGFFDRFIPTDPAARDIGAARESFQDFSQLLARYPNSDYAPDARQRMIHLRNLLARSEIMVGQYYLSREAYVAAVNRGRNVVENYPTTPSVPDGLALMIEGYLKLNLPENANDALRVMLANYPSYEMIDDDGNFVISPEIRNRDRSWLNVVSLGLLDRPDIPPTLQVRAPDAPEAAEPPQPPEMRPRDVEDPQTEPTEPMPGPPPGQGQPGPGGPAPGPGAPGPGPSGPPGPPGSGGMPPGGVM